jgi:hypothetical protein
LVALARVDQVVGRAPQAIEIAGIDRGTGVSRTGRGDSGATAAGNLVQLEL